MASLLAALTIAMLSARQQPAAQSPPAVFRSESRLVVHSVTVKDKNGSAVEGLTANDFVVTEDNDPQQVTLAVFQKIDHDPGEARMASAQLSSPSTSPSGVPAVQVHLSTPHPGDIKYQNRRLIVLYFETSAMDHAAQIRAFTSSLKYVDTEMMASDLVAVLAPQGGAVRVIQSFTGDRARLREVITALVTGGIDLNGDLVSASSEGVTPFGQEDGEFNVFNTDRRLAALQTAVTTLRSLPERKVLVYFQSGLPLTATDNQAQLRATINAANRANVSLYPVDARGLTASAPLGDASSASPTGAALFSGQLAMSTMNGFQQSQDSLYALARDTGGKTLLDYNDLSVGISQAARSITSYYIIGYESSHMAADGRFRRIKVSLRGNSSAELAFRQGYYADKAFTSFTSADKERQLEEALMLENPMTDLTIAMEVNYFQLNRAEYFVPVAVKIPGIEMALARRRGVARTEIDFIGVVKDEYGTTVQNIRDLLPIRLADDAAVQLPTRPIYYDTGFTLLPGKYVIKILVRENVTGRIGTYQSEFVIPNLNREDKRLPISSVVLSSQQVALTDALYSVQQKGVGSAANPLVHDGQKLIPSITRVFSASRDMYVYFQAYERGATTTQPLVVFVTFYQGNVKVLETPPVTVTGGLDDQSKAVPVKFSVSLRTLVPGSYDCQVTVLEPGGAKVTFWRAPVVLVR